MADKKQSIDKQKKQTPAKNDAGSQTNPKKRKQPTPDIVDDDDEDAKVWRQTKKRPTVLLHVMANFPRSAQPDLIH